MNLHQTLPISILVLVVGAGCAGQRAITSYNASSNTTEYRSRSITVAQQLSGEGYGNSSSLQLEATADCEGKNCTPDVITLMFSTSGSSGIVFENRSIEISADERSFTWEDQARLKWSGVKGMATVAGQIAGVRLKRSGFEQILNSASVTGTLGGRGFEVDDRDKMVLRRFLRAMKSPASEN